ncbi:hypothetical protein HMPREF9714_03337 [Myroides odoratimimus CCUG 12901]|uniref:hypothetical protein n=1 Tax=Myroides odoratimimus TaxID=76832 RepID=UPI000246114B|nr:hypothetical protein [Myroides odoratimimus]EHO05399.1 hypothetical protein HMPREF9714_03337 [Myroides odoratimimus CCUG 12901]
MYIFEIIKPGTWLTISDDNSNDLELGNSINFLIEHFFDANVALSLFTEERQLESSSLERKNYIYERTSNLNLESETSIRNRMRKAVELKYKNSKTTFEQIRDETELEVEREKCRQTGIKDYKSDSLIRLEISEVVKSKYINYTYPDKSEKINNDIEIEIKRYKWNQGEIPKNFIHKKIFLYAKAFLFSIDNFEREVEMLYKEPLLKNKIKPLKIRIKEIFPSLRQVRNSAHHFEDISRGQSFGAKIDLQPINNGVIYAPHGGVIVMNQLNGNKYGNTLSDGTFGEVEISPDKIKELQIALQDFLNSLEWKGSIDILPN